MFGFFRKRRRAKLLSAPLPDEWKTFLRHNVAIYDFLCSPEQEYLHHLLKVIVAERPFVGCGGLVITEEMRVTIAAQAALLLLGEDGYYFDRVPTIFVYPNYPRAKAYHDLGSAALVEEDVEVEGQALEQGEIRLAWDEVLYGGRDPADGENVVLHEFAHHLDRLDGEVGGTPPLATDEQHRQWLRVFDHELNELRQSLASRRQTFLHEAAAENRAELFAYSTECFFEQPRELAEMHPELFACLQEFYKIEPREWFMDNG